MGLFRNRQDASAGAVEQLRQDIVRLEGELAKVQSEVGLLRHEWAETSDRVFRWMKRAQKAERAAEPAEPEPTLALDVETPLRIERAPATQPWGARARIAARRAAHAAAGNGGPPPEGE